MECNYEIEYEYDFRISIQSLSKSRRFSLLLISRGEGFIDNICVLSDDLGYVPRFEKSYSHSISYSNLKTLFVMFAIADIVAIFNKISSVRTKLNLVVCMTYVASEPFFITWLPQVFSSSV